MQINPAGVAAFVGGAGGKRVERGTLEEGDLHLAGQDMEGQEPALPLHTVKR